MRYLALLCLLAACSGGGGGDSFSPSTSLSATHAHLFGAWFGQASPDADPFATLYTRLTINPSDTGTAGGSCWITGRISTEGNQPGATTTITAGGDRVLVDLANPGHPRYAHLDLRYSAGRLSGSWVVTRDAAGLDVVDRGRGTVSLQRQTDAPSVTLERYEWDGGVIQIVERRE